MLRGSDSSQDNFIYYLNPDDDTITAFQFAAEYKLAALTPITFQDEVALIDIVSVNNVIYILKYYSLTQKYMVEAFVEDYPATYIKFDSIQSANMAASGIVSGLERLEGYTVQVIYQNQDFGQYLVNAGSITVHNPDAIVDTVFVGLLYDLSFRSMYLFVDSAASSLMKNQSRIYVDYYNSIDFSINGNLVPYQNFADIQAGLPLQPQTDTAIVSPVTGWNRFETISITQTSPFDVQILALGYQIEYAVI